MIKRGSGYEHEKIGGSHPQHTRHPKLRITVQYGSGKSTILNTILLHTFILYQFENNFIKIIKQDMIVILLFKKKFMILRFLVYTYP